MESLEPRLNISATFDYPVNISSFNHYVAYGALTGGGPRVQVQLNNKVILDEFVFEPTFLGGVDVSLTNQNELIVSAGSGGGPRVKEFKLNGQLVKDYFAFDPTDRTGVSLDHGTPRLGYSLVPKAEHTDPIPLLKGVPDRDFPGDPKLFDSQLALVPEPLAKILIANNFQITIFKGPGITILPEWSYLKGQLTTISGDGNRTYDTVGGLALPNGLILNELQANEVLHEIGHYVFSYIFTEEQRQEFINLHKTVSWPTEYELNVEEAAAESFRRFLNEIPNPTGVDSFFNKALSWAI